VGAHPLRSIYGAVAKTIRAAFTTYSTDREHCAGRIADQETAHAEIADQSLKRRDQGEASLFSSSISMNSNAAFVSCMAHE